MNKIKAIEKRNYQTSAPKQIVEALIETNRALVVMATGLGKTITCGMTIQEYFSGKDQYKVLYLCDRNHALDHAEKEFLGKLGMNIIPSRLYGDNESDLNSEAKSIIFASFQKLNSAKRWYQKFDRKHFDMIVVDEAHHAFAETYYSVINYFFVENCKIMGLTATPYRSDQKDIKKLFGPPVIEISLEEGIAMGWLADVDYRIITDGLDETMLQQLLNGELKPRKSSRWTMKQLNTRLFVRKRDDEIVKNIKYFTQGGKKTLIFCQSIKHADYISELLGKRADVVHSGQSADRNLNIVKAFEDGNIKYLIAVDKFNEAVDIPDVAVLVFLRLTDSKRIFFQQLGRGLRKTLSKRRILVLDFAANCQRLIQVSELLTKIREQVEMKQLNVPDPKLEKIIVAFKRQQESLVVNGEHFNFTFTDQVVKMIQVLEVIRKGIFPTWEEAKDVFMSGNFTSSFDYRRRYAEVNLRLPRSPEISWPDFPGWGILRGVSDKKSRHRNTYTKEEIIKQVKNLTKELGRVPVFDDVIAASKENKIASAKRIYAVFGNLPNAVRAAGLIPINNSPRSTSELPTKEELTQELKRISKLVGKKPGRREIDKLVKNGSTKEPFGTYVRTFGSLSEAFIAAGFKTRASDNTRLKRKTPMPNREDLIVELQKIAKQLGRIPTSIDIQKEYDKKRTENYYKVYTRVFGSWKDALVEAHLL